MTSGTEDAAVVLLNAIAEAQESFRVLRRRLQDRSDVREVTHELRFGRGPSFELYADAELMNDEAVSWGVAVGFVGSEWVVESSVRRIHRRGSDSIRDLPTRYAVTSDELVAELQSAVKLTAGIWSESVPMFDGDGYGD